MRRYENLEFCYAPRFKCVQRKIDEVFKYGEILVVSFRFHSYWFFYLSDSFLYTGSWTFPCLFTFLLNPFSDVLETLTKLLNKDKHSLLYICPSKKTLIFR